MAAKKLTHINRQLTDEERARHAAIRDAAVQDFPPKQQGGQASSPPGIPATIREARESRRLTWYALAELAGIDDQSTIRDIEQGKDVRLSDLQRVAGALGLKLELVEQVA
ncbi:MAG: helix-turn-helix domain-containing protein [Pirellulales bacterium]